MADQSSITFKRVSTAPTRMDANTIYLVGQKDGTLSLIVTGKDATASYTNHSLTKNDLLPIVLGAVLTGLDTTKSSDPLAATDTILEALGKIQAQLSLKANLKDPVFDGKPTVPTPEDETETKQVVNIEFLNSKLPKADQTYISLDNIGTEPGQIPLNQSLGRMAFADTIGALNIKQQSPYQLPYDFWPVYVSDTTIRFAIMDSQGNIKVTDDFTLKAPAKGELE